MCVSGLGICLLSFVGCGQKAEIARYQVPHEAPSALPTSDPLAAAAASPTSGTNATAIDQRMLAVIIPVGNQAWFIKAMGATSQVDGIVSEFNEFRESLRFESESSPPTWKLPAGWTQAAGTQFRYATIDARGVDLSVSSLPMNAAQPQDEYVLSNVNRWRGQLQLPPLTAGELASNTQTVELGDRKGIAVDLVGKGTAGGPPMMSGGAGNLPPMLGGSALPPSIPPSTPSSTPPSSTAATNPTPPTAPSSGGLDFDVPEGWQPGRSGPFRLAAFDIQRDSAAAEVTISALGPNAGSLLDNVNRWRGQIKLPPIDDAALQSAIGPIRVAGSDGQWIELIDTAAADATSASQAILVVVVPQATQTLFIKMLGDRQLVTDEKEHFRSFAESLRLPASPAN